MGLSQTFLPSVFLSPTYLHKKSELLPLVDRTIMWPSSALIYQMGSNKSRTLNRFCGSRPETYGLALKRGKHEASTSKGTLLNERCVLREATVAGKNIESTDRAPSMGMGLGIVDFLREKNLLITGATGFLAKVLIEKILRMQPDVGKIFLIIRANESNSALNRLMNEVLNTDLFNGLREIHGNEFQDFLLKKLVPVAGDMTKENLGIEKDMVDVLRKEVDIIVSSGATTTFDERYDVALETNTKGIIRLLEFGKCCEKSQLFLHISTAYVNGQREGRSLEEPFEMGYSISREKSASAPALDVQGEFHLANKALEDFENEFSNLESCKLKKAKIAQRMKDLGMERAKAFGWQDTYAFTKAMAEMLICNHTKELPVVIVRPSIVESTYAQPFPGWIEGHRMIDPIVIHYGKGQLSRFLADPDTVLDLIPVDMVVNATLAAMAKHAGNCGLKVYHVASSVVNPLTVRECFKIIFEHFKCNPYIDGKGNPVKLLKQLTCVNTMENYGQALEAAISSRNNIAGLSKSSTKYMLEHLNQLAKIYEPYAFYKGRFDISNSEKLFQELSADERENFGFDVKNIVWKNYIGNIHIPGFREYVLKGRGTGSSLTKIY